jgi:hypothetical protein
MTGFDVTWDASLLLLITRVGRSISLEEVAAYKCNLTATIDTIASGLSFRWLSNARGYEPLANREAHAVYRSIVPKTLAEHGFRTSLLDLYDCEVAVTCVRDVTCRALAHVHHDAEKMMIFDERFGRDNERYFSDENAARRWLLERLRWLPQTQPACRGGTVTAHREARFSDRRGLEVGPRVASG